MEQPPNSARTGRGSELGGTNSIWDPQSPRPKLKDKQDDSTAALNPPSAEMIQLPSGKLIPKVASNQAPKKSPKLNKSLRDPKDN